MVQSEGRLYLVFEFVDKDLKKYFEACDGPLSASLIKVSYHPFPYITLRLDSWCDAIFTLIITAINYKMP